MAYIQVVVWVVQQGLSPDRKAKDVVIVQSRRLDLNLNLSLMLESQGGPGELPVRSLH